MKQEATHPDREVACISNTKDTIVSVFVAADESFVGKPDEK
jgi:hypothetical protein